MIIFQFKQGLSTNRRSTTKAFSRSGIQAYTFPLPPQTNPS